MQPIHTAFKRNWGSYLKVDVGIYDDLIRFAKKEQLYSGDNLLIGIGHDDPNITPENKLRFDACIEIPSTIAPEEI